MDTFFIQAKIIPTISKSLELRLVEEAVVSPDTLAVFNHPSNKVDIEVTRGSGYFYVVEGRSGVVDLKYMEKSKNIQVGYLNNNKTQKYLRSELMLSNSEDFCWIFGETPF